MDLLGLVRCQNTLTLKVEIRELTHMSGDKIVVRSDKFVTTQPLDN